MFGLNKIRSDMADLRVAIHLLQMNQESDAWHWWYPEGNCYLRRCPVNGMFAMCTRDTKWQFRTIRDQGWTDVSTDRLGMLEYIKEIEAEEAS